MLEGGRECRYTGYPSARPSLCEIVALRNVAILAVVLGVAVAASADTFAVACDHVAGPARVALPTGQQDAAAVLTSGLGGDLSILVGHDIAEADLPVSADIAPDVSTGLITSPPTAPGSASIFLLGLGTLGAVQLGRSIRTVHLDHVPSWFHVGAPSQIGHTVIYDVNNNDLPLCVMDAVAGGRRPSFVVARESESRGQSQWISPTAAPRGPPLRLT